MEFKVSFSQSGKESYSEQVSVDIRFKTSPASEDYIEIMKAVNTIKKQAEKYISLNQPPVIKKGTLNNG